MINKIIEQIIASSPSEVSVVSFGGSSLPSPPYVVVKQGVDPGGAGSSFLIIGHFQPGQQDALRNYMRQTIGEALFQFKAYDSAGGYHALRKDIMDLPGQIVTGNDDNTISIERYYYMNNIAY